VKNHCFFGEFNFLGCKEGEDEQQNKDKEW
jgi:hypothetical protein